MRWCTKAFAIAGLLVLISLNPAWAASSAAPQGAATFDKHCVACHGANATGGLGPRLDGPYVYGGDAQSVAGSIRHGLPPTMPAFDKTLSEAEIRGLVEYLKVKVAEAPPRPPSDLASAPRTAGIRMPAGVIHTSLHDYSVEVVAKVGTPYAMGFLPDGRILITETAGALRVVEQGRLLPDAVVGAPTGDITDMPQPQKRPLTGLAVHPDYKTNGWIYLLHNRAARGAVPGAPILAIITRGRLKDGRWVDSQDIFSVPTQKTNSLRMTFDAKGRLYVGTPYDRSDHPVADAQAKYVGTGKDWPSQDLANPMGKILRMNDDGSVPPDNPFVKTPGAYPYIFSYGHRESMGLTFDAAGELWQSEDGPRGGDEVNHIVKGGNYGWPLITWGHPYQVRPVISYTEREGLQQPVVSWAPSPALADIEYYAGNAFPGWRGSFFVGSLKQRDLFRVTVDGDRVTLIETVLHDLQRIRDIATGPDGFIYLLTDSGDLLRLVPVKSSTTSSALSLRPSD
jgi:glucose/arabinose dehydrogenase/cytochrome c5